MWEANRFCLRMNSTVLPTRVPVSSTVSTISKKVGRVEGRLIAIASYQPYNGTKDGLMDFPTDGCDVWGRVTRTNER